MPRLGRLFCSMAAASAMAWTVVPVAAAAPQAAQPDSCGLVTEAELEPVVGYALEPGAQIVANARASGCGYESSAPADGPDVGVLMTNTATRNAKKLFGVKDLEKTFGKSKTVDGLGTRANFSFKKRKTAQSALLVVDGDNGVEVVLRGATTRAKALAESQAIATLVLTKLA